jgi:hypothetical protein
MFKGFATWNLAVQVKSTEVAEAYREKNKKFIFVYLREDRFESVQLGHKWSARISFEQGDQMSL